jgi:hypothetical protein
VRVGSIFFRTKDHAIDASDRQLLRALAGAYARFAERTKGHVAVTGRVVAYADPRQSDAPDNDQLSQLRATAVASALDAAFATSGIAQTIGFQPFEHEGAGVHPAVPTDMEEGIEGNALGAYRRADIFIDGRGDDLQAPTGQRVEVPRDDRPKPPDYSHRTDAGPDWDYYEIYISRGHKPSINQIAERTLILLGDSANYGDLKDRLTDLLIPKIEPPWWAGRADKPTEPMGRGGPPPQGPNHELIEKARALLADVRLLGFYSLEVEHKDYMRFVTTRDQESKQRLGHLLFMMGEVRREAEEVKGLSQ